MSRQISNILIRDLTAEDNETIQTVMQETGCFQASKAVMKAAYSFVRMTGLVKQQAIRIKELEAENHILRRNATLVIEATRKMESVIVLSK